MDVGAEEVCERSSLSAGKVEKYIKIRSFGARCTWVAILNSSYASMYLLAIAILMFLHPQSKNPGINMVPTKQGLLLCRL